MERNAEKISLLRGDQNRNYEVRLWIVAIVIALGGNVQSYNISVVNNLERIVEQWANETLLTRYHYQASLEQLDFVSSLDMLLVCVAAMIGSVFTIRLCDHYGRKSALYLHALMLIAGSILTTFAPAVNSIELFFFGRFVGGFTQSVGAVTSAMFVSEIAPSSIRGALLTCCQVSKAVVRALAPLVTTRTAFGNEDRWPYAFLFPLPASVTLFLILLVIPETPNYLYYRQSRGVEKSIIFYRGRSALESSVVDLAADSSLHSAASRFSVLELFQRVHRKQMLLGCLTALGALTVSGIIVLNAYSTSVFIAVGIGKTDAEWATVGLSITSLFATLVSMRLVEKCGRRVLILLLFFGCSSQLILLACVAGAPQEMVLSWLACAALVAWYVFYALGASSASYVINELFETSARATASTVVNFLVWLIDAISVLVYAAFQDAAGVSASFAPYIIATLVFGIIIAKELPETKGRPVADIVRELRREVTGINQVCIARVESSI